MGLAAIGSNVEALSLLESLNHGATGQRFHQATPELAALAATEAARLRSITTPIAAPVTANAKADPTAMSSHKYDLSHLTQPLDQNIGGPIQDDEAMLLYAVVRTMRLRRVLEIGGLSGYSARNFLRALSWDVDTAVYTVDLNPVKSQAPNHYTYCKDVAKLEAEDVHGKPLDLVFFDCHVFDAQMGMFVRLANKGLITDETIIALHDTNLHPRKSAPWSYPIRDADGVCGYVHQDVERKMVNALRKDFGYDVFCAHTDVRRNDERLPFRHGVTLMKKFVELKT
jgi:predicted O-methyltransferase YrrM